MDDEWTVSTVAHGSRTGASRPVEHVAPFLPSPPGRPRADDRAALEAIVFEIRTGIPWEMLPQKQFGLSGMTAWRRLEQWTGAGVFEKLQRALLNELGQ